MIVADTARRSGFRVLVLASSCAGEAAPIVGLEVLPVSDLSELIGHFRGEAVIVCGAARVAEREAKVHADMAAVASDHIAVLALNVTLRQLVDEREELELAWLAVAERLE